MLLQRQQSGETLAPSEVSFLEWLWPSDGALFSQRARVAKLARLQQAAETSAARAEAKAKAQESVDALTTVGETLRIEIAQAQERLADLEQHAKQTSMAVEKHDAAVRSLKDPVLLNDVERGRFEHLRQRWEREYGSPSRVCRHEGEGMIAIAGLDPAADAEKILSYASSHRGLDHVVTVRILEGHQRGTAFFHRRMDDDGTGPRPYVAQDRRMITIDVTSWRQFAVRLRELGEEKLHQAEQLEQGGESLRAELDEMLGSLIPA
jgi:hypothetical protein